MLIDKINAMWLSCIKKNERGHKDIHAPRLFPERSYSNIYRDFLSNDVRCTVTAPSSGTKIFLDVMNATPLVQYYRFWWSRVSLWKLLITFSWSITMLSAIKASFDMVSRSFQIISYSFVMIYRLILIRTHCMISY